MRERLTIHTLPATAGSRAAQVPWPQAFGQALERGQAACQAVKANPEWQPDLVVGHGGLIPTFFLRDVLACPIVDYCEYYFAPRGQDLTYRVDLPAVEPARFFPCCINAPTLTSLTGADAGYAPTNWQRQSFPERLQSKIEVHNDGLDTKLYRPRAVPRTIGGQAVPSETKIVTYVARGLESMRGFDLFMQLAARILRERGDVLFVVAGDEEVYYGWDKLFTGKQSFKEWVLARGTYDLTHFRFLGHIADAALAELLCLSDLHVYLTVPFVLSWSLLDALACGAMVLASDVGPVREVIAHEKTGLLAPLFDLDQLTKLALQVLADPWQFRPLGAAARTLMEQNYSLDVTIPKLKDYFERILAQTKSAAR